MKNLQFKDLQKTIFSDIWKKKLKYKASSHEMPLKMSSEKRRTFRHGEDDLNGTKAIGLDSIWS